MTPLEEQFQVLEREFPSTQQTRLASGAVHIRIPDFPLPSGWSTARTSVWFIVPVGYPFAKPDCFWTDKDLRLGAGGMPKSCNLTAIPETGEAPRLWFSWHASQWNPNRDNLSTYVRVVERRLKDPQ